MTDWDAVIKGDFAVPEGLAAAVDELVAMLAAADPAIRDGQAYEVLITWIRRGVLDDRLTALGGTMVARLSHADVQARTFAPLILAAEVERDAAAGLLDAATVRRWRDAFTAWWLTESDLRGWDDDLGWLHAIAHGADLGGSLGASPRLTADEAAALLTVIIERVVAPTPYRYAHMEGDRVARAMIRILARPELTPAQATGWLATVDRLFATGGPGPVPAQVANVLDVLTALYVMADRQPLPHRPAITDAIAGRLHFAFPAYPATRD
ncbi:DUF2785 domain-containing protein [Nonomuraea roseoviolacea]|uniref:DUF2785 domain-containing protein n=1 Tax=Nonomuraea roseoviolacea subsp. carminata TaxID=160689 RepID=A0ABT1JSE2_9ACTN|nr:DUF2785 domain-containing protein [Nonomuraea roseoviolacea]MCP2344515.1 hypothetical protein [Nonomuraea roseoviolacea subsp. carminata]